MKKLFTLLSTFFLFILFSFTSGDNSCSIMLEGEFTYGAGNDLVQVEIKGEDHIEYHDAKKYFIKSKIKWVNDCEYNMTMTKITIPNFPYKKGDVMNVAINKVENNDIYYTSTVKGQSFKGKFTKVK